MEKDGNIIKFSGNLKKIPHSELVALCIRESRLPNGDMPAWNEFFRRFSGTIKKRIMKTLVASNNVGLAEDPDIVGDIFQRVFIKIFDPETLKQMDDKSKIVAWVKKVAHRKTLDWRTSYWKQKNLSQRQAERAITPYDAPYGDDDDLTLSDIIADEQKEPIDIQDLLDRTAEGIDRLGSEEQRVLQLKTIFYNPLTRDDIHSLSDMIGKPVDEVFRKIENVMDRLTEKKNNKKKELETAGNIHSVIRRIEERLRADLSNREISESERTEQLADIRKREERMTQKIHSANQIIEPTNQEVADILGIPEEKAGRISVMLHRIREKIRSFIVREWKQAPK